MGWAALVCGLCIPSENGEFGENSENGIDLWFVGLVPPNENGENGENGENSENGLPNHFHYLVVYLV